MPEAGQRYAKVNESDHTSKWVKAGVIAVVLQCSFTFVIFVVLLAGVFQVKSQITNIDHLNAAETNAFISDVYTMTANARRASEDAPVIVHNSAILSDSFTNVIMSDLNKTDVQQAIKDASAYVQTLDLSFLETTFHNALQLPWTEVVFPLVNKLLDNAANMEQITMLVLSALQQQDASNSFVIEKVPAEYKIESKKNKNN